MTEQDELTEELYDQYVVICVILSMDGGYGKVKMIGRKRDADRNPIGEWNKNNFWTRVFLPIQFDDGALYEYAVNMIYENIQQQIENEDRNQLIMGMIMDHRNDESAVRN